MTFEHGIVIGKLIPRLLPPLGKGQGCIVVSQSPWWGPPVLLPLLPTSYCLHGKEANGWGIPQPWFPWQPSGTPTSSHMTGLSPLPPDPHCCTAIWEERREVALAIHPQSCEHVHRCHLSGLLVSTHP